MAASHDIPEWLLERLAAGDLPAAQANELRQRLRDLGQEERLEALARSNEEILAHHAPQLVSAEIQRRLAAPRRQPTQGLRPLWAFSMATVCAAGLAMLWAVRTPQTGGEVTLAPTTPTEPDYERSKGDPRTPELLVYRKTPQGYEQLHGHANVRRGDMLQIRYAAAGRRFGIIASIDSRSHITFHFPEEAGAAATLARDGERAVPHAYELDDSPGFERFVFVTAESPFDSNEILPLLKNGSPLPSRFSWYELALKKETP